MINLLKISNLALIDRAEIEFGPGLNVVTGETGAGKSVLLGALVLVLGGRADRSLIRSGESRCEVSCIITVPEHNRPAVKALLDELAVDFSGELALRRVISVSSVRNFVNDSPVNAGVLQSLASLLIDVHTANEHQSLHDPLRQLHLLDRYAGDGEELAACAEAWAQLQASERAEREFLSLLPTALEAERCEFVIEDIGKVSPLAGEDEELGKKYALAANSHDIVSIAGELASALSGGERSVIDGLENVYRRMNELAKLTGEAGEKMLDSCAVIEEEVRALSDELLALAEGVELDPEEFAALENRLGEISALKRRYGGTLEAVLSTLEEARIRADIFRRSAERKAELASAIESCRRKLSAAAERLSAVRKKSAEKFCAEILDKLRGLGFPKAHLEMRFTPKTPDSGGADEAEFFFSANAGEDLKSLRKVASSGELSRLMLGIKTVLADADEIESVIFDEIDVNIGGETAGKVGDELKRLGLKRQILSISHLPQVAARGDRHYRVEKEEKNGRTFSHALLLDREGRIAEISRMLGNTAAAAEHAARLLDETL